MFRRRSNVDVEPLERRALLSHVGVAGVMGIRQQAKGRGPALVGSIQGEEVFQANFTHEQFQGTGTVQPMGSVTVSGSFQPNQKTAAVNGRGTLSFWTSQGSVSLSMITRGFFTSPSLKQTNSEELRATVQVRSATSSYADIRVKGTINLVNTIILSHPGAPAPLPFNAEINLKPTK